MRWFFVEFFCIKYELFCNSGTKIDASISVRIPKLPTWEVGRGQLDDHEGAAPHAANLAKTEVYTHFLG